MTRLDKDVGIESQQGTSIGWTGVAVWGSAVSEWAMGWRARTRLCQPTQKGMYTLLSTNPDFVLMS